MLWQIDRRLPLDPQGRHGVAKVLRTGESKLYAEIPEWVIEAVVPDRELLLVLRAQALSAICVPLIARGRTLGAISLLCGESGRRCGEEDLVLLEDLARDAAVAIDNARLYREAAEANRIKDQFLGTLSHELRTPLNAIIGFAEILRDELFGPLENDRYQGYVQDIVGSGRHLLTLISDILDLSRADAGQLTLRETSLDLTAVAVDDERALCLESGRPRDVLTY